LEAPIRSAGGWLPIAGLLAAALLAACGPGGGRSPDTGPVAGTDRSPQAGAGNGRNPLHTPPTDQRMVVAGDSDNGRTLALQAGDRLQVVLGSTYWTLDGSSDPGVLRQVTQPTVSPRTIGCVPGGGCGTVSATFDAVAAGRAGVTARRTTCGEALRCTGSQGLYQITVVVGTG
jgi:hypothetical protein